MRADGEATRATLPHPASIESANRVKTDRVGELRVSEPRSRQPKAAGSPNSGSLISDVAANTIRKRGLSYGTARRTSGSERFACHSSWRTEGLRSMGNVSSNRLLQACSEGDVATARRGLKSVLDINARVGEDGHTLLQGLTQLQGHTLLIVASYYNRIEMVRFLLDEAGAGVNATDKDGRTALHYAKSSEVASLLLLRGANVDARGKIDGRTSLHWTCSDCNADVVKVLLRANASVSIANKEGELPMEKALQRMVVHPEKMGFGLSVLQDLIRHGAKWDPKYEASIVNFRDGYHMPIPSEKQRVRWQAVGPAIRFALILWADEQQEGLPLTNIPEEEIEKGLPATQIYVKARKASKLIVCRRTICVVGPSTAGKTSLVKSLIQKEVCLEKIEERTIGIDHFTLKFDEPTPSLSTVTRTHEVNFSDFAGQDVYQVMHSLFFTKRSLFMVCIDLNAYSIMLLRCEMLTPDERRMQHMMNEYVDRVVLSWIRMIIARQRDAEFMFVCAKEDTVSSGPGVDKDEVLAHVKMMLGRVMVVVEGMKRGTERDQFTLEETREGEELNPITHLWHAGMEEAPRPDVNIIVADATDIQSIQLVRSHLEKLIIGQGKSYETPETYMTVLHELVRRKEAIVTAAITLNLSDVGQIQATIVDVDKLNRELSDKLKANVPDLDPTTTKAILRTLRDCSDILWYEDMEDAKLKKTVILNPKLLIEFLRQVISHKHATGVMYHAKLSGLPFWRELNCNPEAMLAMKKLLQTFRLVHPVSGEMAWSSDLIVPTFWKTNQRAVWKFGGEKLRLNPRGMDVETVARRVVWEFRFTHFIPETLFDHLIVAAYSSSRPLEAGPDWLLYRDGQLAACRVMVSYNWETYERSLLLEAVVSDAAGVAESHEQNLWAVFQRVSDALACVLKEHPGLSVTSFAHTDEEGHQPSLSSILHDVNNDTMIDTTWMPPLPISCECVRRLIGP